MSKELYISLGLNTMSSLNFTTPTQYTPVVTNGDYKTGILKRFIVKKINSMDVFEVSNKQYTKVLKNKFYIGIEIDWVITEKEILKVIIRLLKSVCMRRTQKL